MTSDSSVVLTVVRAHAQRTVVVYRACAADLLDAALDLAPLLVATTLALVPPTTESSLRTIRLRQHCVPNTPFTEERRDVRDDAYCVNLAIAGTALWQQNVFQLAHELAHVLAAPLAAPRLLYRHKNVWFEEAVAHAAALHALRAFDERTARALYPRDRSAFADYADVHVDANVYLVDDDDDDDDDDAHSAAAQPLPTASPRDWYRLHWRQLRDWSCVHKKPARQLQCAVSVWLLRRFGWLAVARCVAALNVHAQHCTDDEFANLSFTAYLQRWLRHCETDEQRHTVVRICAAFGRTRLKRRKCSNE
jgi:hypothetical protein